METKELKKTKIAGKTTFSLIHQQTFEVDDNHVLMLRKSEGTNKSSGQNNFMDGAKVTNIAFLDLTNMSGPQEGYAIMEKDGNKTITKWHGTVITKPSSDGKPMPTFTGTMEQIRGTGKFKNTRGTFRYTGYFTSEKDYVSEWEGELIQK